METKLVFGDILYRLHKAGYHFRLEDDEEHFYLSIIDRKVYPRIWVDNFQDDQLEIIAETTDNLIGRIGLAEKDWKERFSGETIDECLYQAYEWISTKNIT